jgi:hypothetical protein
MALKDWLDTGKCLLGFHQGDWKRENPASCVLIQTCDRCHTISQQVEHDWREWRYASDQSCEFERSCDRCREKESRVEHQWGTWLYRREQACDQGIQCTRCGTWAQDSREEHDWGDWEYQEQYRAPLHACCRCSTIASYFPGQIVEPPAQEPSNSAPAKVQELLSEDKAIEDMQYGSVQTPYAHTRSIVEHVAARLAAGDDAAETVSAALGELDSLDFDEADVPAKNTAILAVYALRAAHDWLAAYDADPKKSDPLPLSLYVLSLTLGIGGFDRDAVLRVAQSVRSNRLSLDGTLLGHARALMVVFGLGLRADPTALPALEQVCVFLAEALAEAEHAAEDVAPEAAEPAPSDFAARCDAILADFERGLNKEGFSEYLMRQASAGLQELQPQSEDEGATLRAALVRMLDLAIPHAPPEAAQTFLVSRESILQQDAPPQPPLDTAGLQAEGEAVLQRLRDELAAGGLPGPAFMRAQAAMQSLGLRVRDEDEEGAKVLMRMMPELVAIVAPYAESEKATLAADLTATMQQIFGETEAMLDDAPARAEVAGQAVMREMKRLAETPTTDPWEQPDALPHLRQFAALLRPWMDRIMALPSLPDADSRDVAEAKRIAKRADIAGQRLRAATTEAQWIEQQRGSLRRVAVELRQFERRYHLMLIEPPWPTRAAAVDANAVFFSGSPEAQAVVEAAYTRIGMRAPVAHGVDDPTHTRWDLLRRSAVAAFDFTDYDRAATDPPGGLPRSREKLEAIAHAAAPVARVAYEYGWALVLGTATVSIAREGQALPFDIDIEPVRLAGDDEDAMRVVLGLQATLFGVQRGLRTADLGATVDRLREYLADDVKAAPLLDALAGSRDAMQVQLGAEALLERAAGHRAMLTLAAFAPVYPSADEPRTLFHVTAFRPWSKPCEEVVHEACSRAGIKYLIGYEQLDPDILGAIWRDIAGASFVVADLTSLNPNAVLELSIAHALGRPTLVLTQTPNLPAHLQALAKVRTHSYATDAVGRLNLARLLERYLSEDPAIC